MLDYARVNPRVVDFMHEEVYGDEDLIEVNGTWHGPQWFVVLIKIALPFGSEFGCTVCPKVNISKIHKEGRCLEELVKHITENHCLGMFIPDRFWTINLWKSIQLAPIRIVAVSKAIKLEYKSLGNGGWPFACNKTIGSLPVGFRGSGETSNNHI